MSRNITIGRRVPELSLEPREEERVPRCPVCGATCETVYTVRFRPWEFIGCDNCVEEADAWEREECFPEEDWL